MRFFSFLQTFSCHKLSNQWVLLGCLAVIINGCSSPQRSSVAASPVSAALGNVEFYTFELANELFAGISPVKQATYAVSGFVAADTLRAEQQQHPLMSLGHQLQQGMLTEASKRGFRTFELSLAKNVIMGNDYDKMLTRDTEQLNDVVAIDYVITGTMLFQETGAMVNARLINVRNNQIVSAATRYFPGELFWQHEQVTTRAGRLYRLDTR